MKTLFYILALVASLTGLDTYAAVSTVGGNVNTNNFVTTNSFIQATQNMVIKVNGTNVVWPVYLTNSSTVSVTNVGGQVSFTATGSGGATNGFQGTNLLRGLFPLTQPTKLLVQGDSLTAGFGHTSLVNWFTYLTNIFLPTNNVVFTTNGAVSGKALVTMVTEYPTYFAPQVTAPSTGTNTIYFQWGGNALFSSELSALAVNGYLTNTWGNARSNGAYVVAFTITDAADYGFTNQVIRNVVNNFIRTNANLYDYLIDVDMLFPNDSVIYGSVDAFTYRDDTIHFTTNADYLIAGHVYNVLTQVPRSKNPYLGNDKSPSFHSLNVLRTVRQGNPIALAYSGSNLEVDMNAGNAFYGTLTKATVLTFLNVPPGLTNHQTVNIELKQDAVGTWAVTTLLTNALVMGGTTNVANNTNANQITEIGAKMSAFTNGQMKIWASTNNF